EPLRNKAQDALVRDTVLEETDDPSVGHGIVKAPDIRIEHPVHPLPQDTNVESIQRIVLTSSWPEPIGKPDEVILLDRLQKPSRPPVGPPCRQDTEWQAAAEFRPPSGCMSDERDGRGSYPCGCDRAVSSVSLRGFLRKPATSRHRCPARSPVRGLTLRTRRA